VRVQPPAEHEIERLQRDLSSRPRLCGYYLLRFMQRTPTAHPFDEGELDRLFETLDDQPWPSRTERETLAPGQTWADYEVDEAAARTAVVEALVVEALVGGPQIGHIEATIPASEAVEIWQRFRALFSPHAHFYGHLGFGDPEHVFSGGVVAVDHERAGALIVVESD
jgi:hypothetical protein